MLNVLFIASLSSTSPAEEKAAPAPFDSGEIRLLRTDGGERTEYRYLKRGDHLRIERLGETRPPHPVNLLDLKAKELTILRPINSSSITLPFGIWDRPDDAPGLPGLPPGFPADFPGAPPSFPGLPPEAPAGLPAGIPSGPPGAPPAGLPGLPPGAPDLPSIPSPPSGIPNIPGIPGIPPAGMGMPLMPGLPGMDAGPATLEAGEETQTLHGYSCRRHTLTLARHRQRLTLWLADDKSLPPFFLLKSQPPSRFVPADELSRWPALVREKGLFPFLVTVEEVPFAPQEGGRENEEETPVRELARWEVLSLTVREAGAGNDDDELFSIPEGYLRDDP